MTGSVLGRASGPVWPEGVALLGRLAGTAAVFVGLCLGAGCDKPKRPSLLLVTIDTLRADHLSNYGYRHPTSPRIDALAQRGVAFEEVIAPIPTTSPALASMLTGRWPAELDIHTNAQPLRPEARTLAEILQARGYRTAAFVSGFPLTRRLSGLDQGFAHYDDTLPDPRGGVPGVQRFAEKTTDAVLTWSKDALDDPFFLWVHYYDPHGDYAPGPAYEDRFHEGAPGPTVPLDDIPAYQRVGSVTDTSVYVARYDGEILRVDTEIGRLLDGFETRGLLENTVVVVTADHGESLTEHGYYFDHGNELYLPSLRVPLIFAGPGIPTDGRRIDGLVRTPDIFSTLLDVLGVPAPEPVPGRSFRRALTGVAETDPRESFSEARFVRYKELTPRSDVGPKLAVRDDRFTAILRLNGEVVELYDRHADPQEVRNLLVPAQDPAIGVDELAATIRNGLLAQLDAIRSAGGFDEQVFDAPLRRQLEEFADRAGGQRASVAGRRQFPALR